MSHSVLFVCYGNTCRSPMSEAIFKNILHRNKATNKWKVDSCGTNPNPGSPPSGGGQRCMESLGIFHHVKDHKARKLTVEDLKNYDYVFGMDEGNIRSIQSMAKIIKHNAKIMLLGSFDPESTGGVITDPIGQPDEKYQLTFEQCERACSKFYNKLS